MVRIGKAMGFLLLAALLPAWGAAQAPARVAPPGPAPTGSVDADEALVAAFYKVAHAYERKGRPDEAVRYLRKVLEVAPRPELVADAAYRVGYFHVRRLDFDLAERYLQQSLAAQSPADVTLRLNTQHALAWLDFLRGRPQEALAQARRFNATFDGEPLMASVVEKHPWMDGMMKDMARLVAIITLCHGGRTLDDLQKDVALARDFSALVPYLPEAYHRECVVPGARVSLQQDG
jgi:tetratricopeptide (TPR) repeat protein